MRTKVYHVVSGNKHELEALTKVKPSHILVSYYYFKNKSMRTLCEELGYQPKILLDSGAYSAFSIGRNISPIDYMNYIDQNLTYLDWYISLDVIGDPWLSEKYYEIMRKKNYTPCPVYHIGDPWEYLERYVADSERVSLGGTVFIKDKKKVADWICSVQEKYPNTRFHLLGSSSTWILDIPGLESCDSSTWILQAKNGVPRHIKGTTSEAKIQRAIYNLRKIAEVQEQRGDHQTIEEFSRESREELGTEECYADVHDNVVTSENRAGLQPRGLDRPRIPKKCNCLGMYQHDCDQCARSTTENIPNDSKRGSGSPEPLAFSSDPETELVNLDLRDVGIDSYLPKYSR